LLRIFSPFVPRMLSDVSFSADRTAPATFFRRGGDKDARVALAFGRPTGEAERERVR
jgi:hypothetical protein